MTNRSTSPLLRLVAALGLLLALQSCSKETEQLLPVLGQAAAAEAALVPPAPCTSVCLVAGQHQ